MTLIFIMAESDCDNNNIYNNDDIDDINDNNMNNDNNQNNNNI